MPFKGRFTASAVVLFERPVPLDAVAAALDDFDIVNRIDTANNWAFGGPSVTLAFRPEVNGQVRVDTVAHPWPDHMGDPQKEPILMGAWTLGHFGPFAFPNGLQRASQQAWAWDDGKSIPERHAAFVRVLASYAFGLPENAPLIPEGYASIAELEFVTRVSQAVLKLPGALAYFNPNGETLWPADMIGGAIASADEQGVPPIDVWANVRLFNVENGWLVMDTVGNGQFGFPDFPDIEACVPRGADLRAVDAFLRNTTLYVLNAGDVIRDGDTIDGPGGSLWVCRPRKNGLVDPPRRVLRFFPADVVPPPEMLKE